MLGRPCVRNTRGRIPRFRDSERRDTSRQVGVQIRSPAHPRRRIHPGTSRRDRSSRSRFRPNPADVGKSRARPVDSPVRGHGRQGRQEKSMSSWHRAPRPASLRTDSRSGSGSRNPELPVSRIGEPAPARCPPSLAPSQAAARKRPLTRPGSRLRSDADGGGRLPGSCSRMRSFPHAFPYRPPA